MKGKVEKTEPQTAQSEENFAAIVLDAQNQIIKQETPKVESKISDDEIEKTVEMVKAKYGVETKGKALAITCLALQRGAVAAKKGNSFQIKLEGKIVTSSDIGQLIAAGCGQSTTPRSFARRIGNIIFQISKKNQTPGNLNMIFEKQFTKEWEAITDPDKIYWASDFQSQTTECPEEIRALINKQYEQKFKK